MIKKLLFILSLFLITPSVSFATTASSCSKTDVETARDATSAGGTLYIPSGTCTWLGSVDIDKELTIIGNTTTTRNNTTYDMTVSSNTIIRAGYFTSSTTDPVKVQGITFTGVKDITCDTTSGSTTVTMDDTSLVYAGASVSGTGIPYNTTVSSVDSSTQITLSANATATNTNTILSFGPPRFNMSGSYVANLEVTQCYFQNVARIFPKANLSGLWFHHNYILNPSGEHMYMLGPGNSSWSDHNTYGVESNWIEDIKFSNDDASAYPGEFVWVERNYWTYDTSGYMTNGNNPFDTGDGLRLVFRYNKLENTETIGFQFMLETHGHCWLYRDTTQNASAYWIIMHNNKVDDNGHDYQQFFRPRGGRATIYNNEITSTGSWYDEVYIHADEIGSSLCNNSQGPCAVQAHEDMGMHEVPLSGDPNYSDGMTCDSYPCAMQANNIFVWGNEKNSDSTLFDLSVEDSDFFTLNRDYWFDDAGGNFTEGVAASMGSTCTNEDVYWTTDTRKLYLCEGTDNYQLIYTEAGEYGEAAVSATLSGTIASGATEAEIRTGGKTLIITITNDTLEIFDNTIRAAIVAGLNAASSQNSTDWSSLVEGDENSWSASGVVRTDSTTITVTFPDFDGDPNTQYDITTDEVITVQVPASALVTSTDPVNASGSFTITAPDTTNPTVTISDSDPKAVSNSSTTLTGTASDTNGIDECKWRLSSAPDESNGTSCSGTTAWSCSVTGLSEGSNSVYVGCADPSNNWGSDSITVNYTIQSQSAKILKFNGGSVIKNTGKGLIIKVH